MPGANFEIGKGTARNTVDDINPALAYLRTLNYGNCGLFLIMGNSGFISSAELPNTTASILASMASAERRLRTPARVSRVEGMRLRLYRNC